MLKERRKKDRLEYTLPLSVRGTEPCGTAYRLETVAQNIGAGGLCALGTRPMSVGERVSLRVRFARPGSRTVQVAEVSRGGLVIRTEKTLAGLCRFAVSFTVGNREEI